MKKLNTFDLINEPQKSNHFIKLLIRTAFLFCFVFQFIISTQARTLDPSFGNGGSVTLRVRNSFDKAHKLIIQPDGKILAIGVSNLGQSPTTGSRVDPLLVRYNSDGTLDSSFGNGGIVLTELEASSYLSSAVLQPDGKIIVAGTYYGSTQLDFLLIRYLSNGSLDTSFGNNGVVKTNFSSNMESQSLAVVSRQPDGKIIVAGTGYFTVIVARYNENGSLDQTFGTGGRVITNQGISPRTIVLQTDGKIILGCMLNILVRFMPNGPIDTEFGIDGRIIIGSSAYSLLLTDFDLLPDGKFLVGGVARAYLQDDDFRLMRLNHDGTLDTSFGINGAVTTDFSSNRDTLERLKLLPNGDIAAVGTVQRRRVNPSSFNTAVALYDSKGKLKSKTVLKSVVGSLGVVDSMGYNLDVQDDGKILIAGSTVFDLLVSRYLDITNDVKPPRLNDFDGDGVTDFGVLQTSTNKVWQIDFSGNDYVINSQFGLEEDILAPADFDGDGKTDLGVFRPSTGTWWHTWLPGPASSNHRSFQWGMAGDIPVAGDYDGDSKADYAVFRPSEGAWYINNSIDGSYSAVHWGLADDKPVVGDYDGDNKCDVAVFRPSTGVWYVLRSSDYQVRAIQFGLDGDKPVQADFDGDGKTDVAVYRPNEGMWYVLRSLDGGVKIQPWGINTDVPVVGDYDGDGKADFAVYRQGEGLWYVLKSSDDNYFTKQWGNSTDIPIPGN